MEKTKKAAWLIDYPIKGSGGHKTFFYYINHLIEIGYEVDVYVYDFLGVNASPVTDPSSLAAVVADYLIPSRANFYYGWKPKGVYDFMFATWFPNAPVVADYPYAKHKIFFEQEYEPFFTMMGDQTIKAQNAYHLGLTGITMGGWLAKELTAKHNMEAYPLYLGADLDSYYDKGRFRDNAVCFIYQSNKPRRCPQLTIETIDVLHAVDPSIRIYTFGGEDVPPVAGATHQGLLRIKDLNKLYNQCKVGVAYSTTNPSRIPFEMMAAGLPVVELYADNNLYDIPTKAALLAKPDPFAAATAILKLLKDEELWAEKSRGGLEFMRTKSLDKSVKDFAKILSDITISKQNPNTKIEKLYLDKQIDADPRLVKKYNYVKATHSDFLKTGDKLSFNGSLTRFAKYQVKRAVSPVRSFKSFVLNLIRSTVSVSKNLISRVKLELFILGNTKLFSSDIFDTLVRREVHPDEIKLRSSWMMKLKFNNYAERLSVLELFELRRSVESKIGADNVAQGKDHEYELEQVFEQVLRIIAPDRSKSFYQDNARQLTEWEMQHEMKVLYPDRFGQSVFKRIKAETKILLSDFYMTKEALNKILPLKDIRSEIKQIVSSADTRLNKISGRAYDHLHRRFKVNPSEHKHLGDNKWSDYEKPASIGIKSALFINPKEEEKRAALNEAFSQRLSKEGFPYKEEMESLLNEIKVPEGYSKEESELFKLGTKYSPIYFFYVLQLWETAYKLGIETIHYFTREGIFFKKIHDQFAKHSFFPFKEIKSDLIEVSRMSTFAASVGSVEFYELKRIWNQYKYQSINSFLVTLGIDPALFAEDIKKFKIDPEKEVEIWKVAKYQNLFADKNFVEKLQGMLNKKRELLVGYLQQKGISQQSKQVLVSDIGWRGTIQDNIARIFNQVDFYGVYLGYIHPLNNQEFNTFKHAYGPYFVSDAPYFMQMLHGGATFVEMLSTSPGGSTIGYEHADKNKIVAVKEVSKVEDEYIHNKYVRFFQEGVIASVAALANFTDKHALQSSEARPYVLRLMDDLIKKPNYLFSKIFFNLTYSETFGVGEYFDMKKRSALKKRNLVLAIISKSRRENIEEAVNQSQWKQGFWRYQDRLGIFSVASKVYYDLQNARNALAPKRRILQLLSKVGKLKKKILG